MTIRLALTTAAGLAALAAVLWFYDIGLIAAALAAAGASILPLIAVRLAITVLTAAAWMPLAGRPRPGALTFLQLRLVRDGVNTLLPVAQIGGEIVGARLLVRTGVPGGRATAGLLADILLQTAAQLAYVAAGALILLYLGAGGPILWAAAALIGLGVPALAAFVLAQRRGLALAEAALRRLAPTGSAAIAGSAREVAAGLDAVWRDRLGLTKSFALHLAAWFVGTLEVLLVMQALGHPVTVAEAVVIESLGQAIRTAAFAVPGAIGVQEGGFVAVCAIFGVPPAAAIALSLAKRAPDLVFGLTGLGLWALREVGSKEQAPSDAS